MTSASIYLQDAPHARIRFHPLNVFASAWAHGGLIYRLARREVESRYKGSLLGLVWSFLVPLLMLGIYTFVFSVIFQNRWPEKHIPFFLIVFAGMICLNLFTECIGRAPVLMLSNVSYIKKVVFPLEILPLVILSAEIFNACISSLILAAAYVWRLGIPPATALLLPLVLLPLLLITCGLLWFISSLGVYLRDLRQLVAVLLSMLGFISPLFYPITVFPPKVRWAIYLNPLTVVLEQVRAVLFYGHAPDWRTWGIYLAASWVVAWLGLVWFSHAQRGFADVV